MATYKTRKKNVDFAAEERAAGNTIFNGDILNGFLDR